MIERIEMICWTVIVLMFALICVCILYDEGILSEEWRYVSYALGVIEWVGLCVFAYYVMKE